MRKDRDCEIDANAVERHSLATVESSGISRGKWELLVKEGVLRGEEGIEGDTGNENVFTIDENRVMLGKEAHANQSTQPDEFGLLGMCQES